ncbi:peptide chain release factor N(5)-glutamine methyltransferase [Altererythrobacter sp. MF3-039]|uniref:peptide chain release factor N(5)-glutamine methyltransferase n=1 Tax=Altererythrobacter sp. MF3-039 TaxID=3252901 RepID=UPI00390C42BE
MSDPARMKIAEAIRMAAERLSETSDTARLDAELLMAHALGTSRSDMLLGRMQDAAPECFSALVERRSGDEPVAYIIGQQEFFGLDFAVTPDALIPRGDSETIVEAALELTGDSGRAIDLGTGSGALLLAFLDNRPSWTGIGIDASEPALEIARRNSEMLDLDGRAEMRQANWNDQDWAINLGRFDLVLSNPPYVETGADLAPSVADFEPSTALYAGPDGLDDYRRLIPQLKAILAPTGLAIFEIGHKQGDALMDLAASHGFSCEIRTDLAKRPRAAILTRGVGKAKQSV